MIINIILKIANGVIYILNKCMSVVFVCSNKTKNKTHILKYLFGCIRGLVIRIKYIFVCIINGLIIIIKNRDLTTKFYKVVDINNNSNNCRNIGTFKTVAYIPKFFKDNSNSSVLESKEKIYVCEIRDAVIFGQCSMILQKDNCIYEQAYNNGYRLQVYNKYIHRLNNKTALISTSKKYLDIDKGIFLVGFGSYNYYHFLFEIMSRLRYIDDCKEYDEYPLLIDDVTNNIKQFKEIIEIFNIKKRKIIYIEESKFYKVGNLINISANTKLPINLKKNFDYEVSDYFVVEEAINNIVNYCKEHINNNTPPNRKIFISRRNCSVSRLDNENRIREIFKNNGFEIVCLENTTFKEQIKIFNNSSCVVGTSGAALTNLVFCRPGTKFCCIIPKEQHFYLYSSIAYLRGLKCLFISPKITKRTDFISTDTFELDEDICKEIINELK